MGPTSVQYFHPENGYEKDAVDREEFMKFCLENGWSLPDEGDSEINVDYDDDSDDDSICS